MGFTIRHISNKDRGKILSRLNEEGKAVLIAQSGGRLRVHSLDQYLLRKRRMSVDIRKWQPWAYRRKSKLGPIGSKSLEVHADLSREAFYERE